MNMQFKNELAPPVAPQYDSTSALILDPQAMNNMVAFADFMCKATITVPKHLQGNSGDCLAVTMQAMQWGMNPFAVAQKTHLVSGNLGYEAQLINAVIISRAPITGRPNYEWYGDWSKVDGKTCKQHDVGVRVWATIKGESEPRVLDISFAQVGNVRNSPNWVNDPKQQIAYLAIKRWSRLHTPDVILGVYDPDELAESHGNNARPIRDISGVTEPEGYAEFETQHLAHFRNEAQYGTDRLSAAHAALPKSHCKNHFWTTHKEDLKAIAELADKHIQDNADDNITA